MAHLTPGRQTAETTVHVGVHPVAVAVDQSTGHVFVANQGIMRASGPISTSLSILSATTGALQRTIPMSEAPIGLAVDDQTNHLFVVTVHASAGPYTVLMLDGRTGRLLHAARRLSGDMLPNGVQAMIVAQRAHRLFVKDANGINAFDTRTGQALGRAPLCINGNCPSSPIPVPVPNTVPVLHGNLAVDERSGHLLVANGCDIPLVSGCLAIYSSATGDQLAAPEVGLPITDLAVDEQLGRVVVADDIERGGSSTWIALVNARTGAIVHSADLSRRGDVPPVITIGTDAHTGHAVLVATWDGYTADYNGGIGGEAAILLLDTRSGHVLNRVDSSAGGNRYPPTTQIVVDERTSRAFVLGDAVPGDGPGQVLTVDTRTGDVLDSLDVSPDSTGLALDEQTSRVFVTHRTQNTVSVIDAS